MAAHRSIYGRGRLSTTRYRRSDTSSDYVSSSSKTGIRRRRLPMMTMVAAETSTATAATVITTVTGPASPTPAAADVGPGRRGTAPGATPCSSLGLGSHASHDSGPLSSAWASFPALSCRRAAPYPAPWVAAGFPRRECHVSTSNRPWKLTPSAWVTAHPLLSGRWRQTPCALKPASVPRRKQLTSLLLPHSPSTVTRGWPMILGPRAAAWCGS